MSYSTHGIFSGDYALQTGSTIEYIVATDTLLAKHLSDVWENLVLELEYSSIYKVPYTSYNKQHKILIDRYKRLYEEKKAQFQQD